MQKLKMDSKKMKVYKKGNKYQMVKISGEAVEADKTESFTTSGNYTWTPPAGIVGTTIQYEVAGAGGGSGETEMAWGNGGNGDRKIGSMSISTTPIEVIIGKGGESYSDAEYAEGDNGGKSSFGNIKALGGGGGYAEWEDGADGSDAGNGQGGKGAGKPPLYLSNGQDGWVKITYTVLEQQDTYKAFEE